MCGKHFEKRKKITKHMLKKHMLIFDPNQRYQDSRHIFQNLKVLQSVMGFGNRAQSFTTPYYLHVDSPLVKVKQRKTSKNVPSAYINLKSKPILINIFS